MNERYPCLYSVTALICTMSFLQSIVFALCTERDWSEWKLSWDLRLLTAAYSVLHPSFFFLYTRLEDFKPYAPLVSMKNFV